MVVGVGGVVVPPNISSVRVHERLVGACLFEAAIFAMTSKKTPSRLRSCSAKRLISCRLATPAEFSPNHVERRRHACCDKSQPRQRRRAAVKMTSRGVLTSRQLRQVTSLYATGSHESSPVCSALFSHTSCVRSGPNCACNAVLHYEFCGMLNASFTFYASLRLNYDARTIIDVIERVL